MTDNNGIKLQGTKKVKEVTNTVSARPLVSVCVITYNHENYIKQCLDSILSQETDFEYELLLGEDDSQDNTRKICLEYAKKYPDKIRLFLHDRSNVIKIAGKPTGRYNALFNFSQARGQYLAFCEGDDFWNDKTKLQKEVDFLQKNKDFSLVFHPVYVQHVEERSLKEVYPDPTIDPADYTINKLVYVNFIHNTSVMYRKVDYKKLIKDTMPGDWYFHLYHAQYGKLGYIPDVMATYRRHKGGIWWGALRNRQEFLKNYAFKHIELYLIIADMFNSPEQLHSRNLNIANMVKMICDEDSGVLAEFAKQLSGKNRILEGIICSYAENMSYIDRQNQEQEKENSRLNTQLRAVHDELEVQADAVKILKNRINEIENSKLFKLRDKAYKAIKPGGKR